MVRLTLKSGSSIVECLDSLRADVLFGWRQIRKNKVTSAAAIVSLALAMGASISAFRLIDALLLRPLPVSEPERLYSLSRQGIGAAASHDGWEYRLFRPLRAAVKGQAELIAVSFAEHADLTYSSDEEMEKAHVQYVSGWMFGSFGLRPAAGRLFTENDDLEPGANPVAVISYDYWSRRFGRDSKAIGRTFHLANQVFQIVGVVEQPFTGTEPGTISDVFLPVTMNELATNPMASFLRTFVRLEPVVKAEPVRERLRAAFQRLQEEELPERRGQAFFMEPAASGVSGVQKSYRLSLTVLGMLVALVLLIACANVANLMTAQGAARSREMALRVAIGAGRWRLIQLVLVESAMLAALASALGGWFAWWSAPWVVNRINPPDNPARLMLPADWRLFAFGALLTLGVTFVFGLAPALRTSSVGPSGALKGGEDPQLRRRSMHVLIAFQAAFGCVVIFLGSLLVGTFHRLSNQPLGFSADRVLTLSTVVQGAGQRQVPPVVWEQIAEHLRTVPGVERVALAEWALMDGWGIKFSSVSVDGAPAGPWESFLSVSPGWFETMKIPLLNGRDFRADDVYITPARTGVAIVNQAFARQYFHGGNPVGRTFETVGRNGIGGMRFEIVGLVGDARHLNDIREPIGPVIYNAFRWVEGAGWARAPHLGTFIVRTAGPNPLALASILRKEVSRARSEFYVSNIRTQQELIEIHTVRERLLAMLALFFSGVAVLLAGVGMYGVLDYSVVQRRREIGIRMAIGAQSADIARRVTSEVFAMVLVGSIAGVTLGIASARFIHTLLYGVRADDWAMLAIPAVTILSAALLAALPAVIRAVRIDPVAMLRAE
jgi:putative ABC transport system permease protein